MPKGFGGLGEQLAVLMVETLTAGQRDPNSIEDDQLQTIAREVVTDYAARGERLPGYGIPLHGADPRAPGVLAVAKREQTFGAYCRFAAYLGEALAESRNGKEIPMNVDGVSAAVILDLGFSWQTTRMFLITARTVSATAHFIEEQAQDTTWRHIPAAAIDYGGEQPG